MKPTVTPRDGWVDCETAGGGRRGGGHAHVGGRPSRMKNEGSELIDTGTPSEARQN